VALGDRELVPGGFWEEALFRAVPIAGAALIGDRFGKRNLFIAVAFVVQAIIFGAGHAPYPNQPATRARSN
jgi:membrane protease YdiL (CAAX protease family)